VSGTQAVERYIETAGRGLAAATQAELRAALMQSLHERGLDANKAEDQAGVLAALSEFGRPEQIARELLTCGLTIEMEKK
jgi:hypothetical protein